jgi:hypothetical protein
MFRVFLSQYVAVIKSLISFKELDFKEVRKEYDSCGGSS